MRFHEDYNWFDIYAPTLAHSLSRVLSLSHTCVCASVCVWPNDWIGDLLTTFILASTTSVFRLSNTTSGSCFWQKEVQKPYLNNMLKPHIIHTRMCGPVYLYYVQGSVYIHSLYKKSCNSFTQFTCIDIKLIVCLSLCSLHKIPLNSWLKDNIRPMSSILLYIRAYIINLMSRYKGIRAAQIAFKYTRI